MYQKYMVYVDDGLNVYKIAIAADCEESAAAWCAGNGEVIAVRDVTADYPISIDKVSQALLDGMFNRTEVDFITRLLTEFGIAN